MITSINLENFKAFKNLGTLKLKPVTILTGTNSCGKSTILQSLLLLKQTIESKNVNQTLLLNGRFVHLGTFENIIHSKNIDNSITLNLSFQVRKDTTYNNKRGEYPMYFILREMISEKSYDLPNASYSFNYKVTLKTEDKPGKGKAYVKPLIILRAELQIKTIVNEIHGLYEIDEGTITFEYSDSVTYNIKWTNLSARYFSHREGMAQSGDIIATVQFINLLPITIVLNDDKKRLPIDFILYRFQELLQLEFSKITYIGPLREEPSRRYIYEDEIVEIGTKGENAAYIFLSEQEETISKVFFYNPLTDTFDFQDKPISLFDALNRWNVLMNINDFRPEVYNDVIQLNLRSASGKNKVNIADVGFGVSQIFPILLEGLRMSTGGTMILEQPEIHLHPNLQMQLADYFICLALSGKNVIVETHSDHIVNRIVRRIVEEKSHPLKDLIGLYYIQPSEDGALFEEVKIDERLGIVNWPKDFFDQSANEQEKIIRASLERRLNK